MARRLQIDDGCASGDDNQNTAFSVSARSMDQIWHDLSMLDLDGYKMDRVWSEAIRGISDLNLPENKARAIGEIIEKYKIIAV